MNTKIIFAGAVNLARVSAGGIVSASDSLPSTPATNLQNALMYQPWRSNGVDGEKWIQCEATDSARMSFRFVSLHGINSPAAGTAEIRFTASDDPGHLTIIEDSGWGNLSYPPGSSGFGELDWGTFPLFPQLGTAEPARDAFWPITTTLADTSRALRTVSARYVRVWLRGDQAAGYWEASHLVVGMAFQPPVQFAWGRELGAEDLSEIERGPYGSIFPSERGQVGSMPLSINHVVPAATYGELLKLSRTVGTTRPFVVLPEADLPGLYVRYEAGLYRLAKPLRASEQKGNRWNVSIDLEEWK